MSGQGRGSSVVSRLRKAGPDGASQAVDSARRIALEERQLAARREKLPVRPDSPPFLRVEAPSGFSYRIHLRGDAGGPHSCDCPDFEANGLHTCKHVERVRTWLGSARSRLALEHRRQALRSRVYLHFGEVIEPRLFGRPRGASASIVQRAFGEDGSALRPAGGDEATLRRWLDRFSDQVEPQALDWLDRRIDRRPILPDRAFASLLPTPGLKPYPYQWKGAEFLARTGRALLADEMGLGKTVQAILAATAMRSASRPARSVTIVCPASLRGG
jgi:hypothetical protein